MGLPLRMSAKNRPFWTLSIWWAVMFFICIVYYIYFQHYMAGNVWLFHPGGLNSITIRLASYPIPCTHWVYPLSPVRVDVTSLMDSPMVFSNQAHSSPWTIGHPTCHIVTIQMAISLQLHCVVSFYFPIYYFTVFISKCTFLYCIPT